MTALRFMVVEEDLSMASRSLNLKGIFTALVTPFSKDGNSVDYDSLARLIESQIAAQVAGVVVCGSTGEAATLSDREYVEVVRFVRERTLGSLPCVAGISVSATARAIELAKIAAEIGCDGLLIATPPYNKPSQGGIIEHFKSLRAAVDVPLVAYNIPGRSGVAIAPATLGKLSRDGIIVGIKESSGSVDALADTMIAIDSRCQVVSGDDSLLLATLTYGGTGAISACSNVMPNEFVALEEAFSQGECSQAKDLQLSILPKIRTLFVEANPVPVKAALAFKGIIAHPTVRLPLVPLVAENAERVQREFSV
jgi:4-hydroxy-tetrahydrodipicolinate synthase